MPRRLFWPLSLLCALALWSREAAAGVLPTPPLIDKLENGLTVITVPFDSPGIIAYYTVVRVGSRNEVEPGHSGFAHFFEHMMFRGTKRYPQEKYNAVLQRYGADNNAFTTDDYTCYTIVGPKEALPALVEIEADRFANLSYPLEAFQTESRAVLGEYAKSASDPSNALFEALRKAAFGAHTYRHTTLGFLEDIQAMPKEYEYSQKFFARYYTPENSTLIVVGDVNHAELLALVKKEYSGWRRTLDAAPVPAEPEQSAPRQITLPWSAPTQPRLLVGYKTPGFAQSLADTAALHVLHELAFGAASPLYKRLVLEEKLLEELAPYSGWHHRDPHLLLVEAVPREGASYDAVIEAFQQTLDGIASGAVDAAAVEATRKHLRYETLMGFDTVAGVAGALAQMVAMTGDVTSLDAYLAAISAVKPEDLSRVAKSYLSPARRTVASLGLGGAK